MKNKVNATIEKTERVKKIWRSLFRIVVVLFMVFSCIYIVFFIFSKQIESYLYFPGAYKEASWNIPELPSDWEKIYFEIEGEQVFWVYIDNKAKETIYFFHGNGGDLRYFSEAIDIYLSWWYNVLALEYPWYAGLKGYPTAENITLAAAELYELAQEKYSLKDETTFVWWYSIWAGLAASFVKSSEFPVLVLESPYTSWYDLARDRIGFIPQRFLWIDNNFDTERNLSSYNGKVLIVHGERDSVIPVLHTYRLQEAVEEKITAVVDPKGDHFNLLDNPENTSKIEYFLENKELDLKEYEADQKLIKLREVIELDISSDESYTKYVDPNVAYNQRDYIPGDMRALDKTHVRDIKWDLKLRREAAASFEWLAQDFYNIFWKKIDVVSSYRSYSYQAGIKSRGCPDNLCAKAWHSEHQWWLAIDLWSASSIWEWQKNETLQSYYNWLWENAHLYGWHNPYRNWVDIDGYEPEPWHWRYLWPDLSRYLYQQDVTFAQYYKARIRAPSY